MYEVEDQETWYEVQVLSSTGRWLMVSTHDTREEADDSRTVGCRVKQVRGLA
jgi:hypothetical protein